MENLQKIVVLCVVLIIGILIGAQFVSAPDEDGMTQIDPPSLDMDAGPADADTNNEEVPAPDEPDQVTTAPVDGGGQVACTMDAKMCPDGSFVGRVAPDCAFAACPDSPPANDDTVGTICPDESRNVDACIEIYQPVCGLTRIECITTPCDPIPETYSNSCFACQNERVISYTEGECRASL